jgi:hypothetical protein
VEETLHLVGKNVAYDDGKRRARVCVCVRACMRERDLVTETSHECEYVCAWRRKRNRGMNREKCQAEDSFCLISPNCHPHFDLKSFVVVKYILYSNIISQVICRFSCLRRQNINKYFKQHVFSTEDTPLCFIT